LTAKTAGVSETFTIRVDGSTVGISGLGSVKTGDQISYTVTAVDFDNLPIKDAKLTITSITDIVNESDNTLVIDTTNKLSWKNDEGTDVVGINGTIDVKTNSEGKATVTFTAGKVAGNYTLTVSGLGSVGKTIDGKDVQKYVSKATKVVTVSATTDVTLQFDTSYEDKTKNTDPNKLIVNQQNPVKVVYKEKILGVDTPMPDKTVIFSSNRGKVTPGSATTNINGEATVNLNSDSAGPVIISAKLNDNKLVSDTVDGYFISTVPYKINLQANPAVVLPNSVSRLKAVVRDKTDNPVQDILVNFTMLKDGSQGSISETVQLTNSAGIAETEFKSGALTTGSNGVEITASYTYLTATKVDTAYLTVSGEALSMSIGGSSVISESDDKTEYRKVFAVHVLDANGSPVANKEVTLTASPTAYKKGHMAYFDPDGWDIVAPYYLCSYNEDTDLNGILDDGEDRNGDKVLQPGNAVGILNGTDGNLIQMTDQNGVVSTTVAGTEFKVTRNYPLEMSFDDAINKADPANKYSPYKDNACSAKD